MIITKNCVVTLDYSVCDTEKKVLDNGEHPLVYLHGGYNDIFPKLEKELEGKKVGDTISVQLTPKESFGEYDENLLIVEPRSQFDEHIFVGEQFEEIFEDDDDNSETITYKVKAYNKETVTLEGNHPLAGKHIVFDATVTEVRKATASEIKEQYAR